MTKILRSMMCAVLLALVVASVASAQQVIRYVDFSGYGWGLVAIELIDTDGILPTREWAVQSVDRNRATYGQWRIVAERNGSMCAGPWFSPLAYGQGIQIVSRHFRSTMIVTSGFDASRFYEIALQTPSC